MTATHFDKSTAASVGCCDLFAKEKNWEVLNMIRVFIHSKYGSSNENKLFDYVLFVLDGISKNKPAGFLTRDDI